jgi:FK506-binding protein 2
MYILEPECPSPSEAPDVSCWRRTCRWRPSKLCARLRALTFQDYLATLSLPAILPNTQLTSPFPPTDYRGTLHSDGSQFDASYDRGQPLDFALGTGRVIKGWDQGLLDMCIGEKRRLTIAPELGYGDRAVGPIPANSILVFETELVGIRGVEKEEKKEL